MPIEVLEPKTKIGEPTINDFHQNSAIFNAKGINDSLAINEEIQEIPIESQMEPEEDFFISNSCDIKIEEVMEGDHTIIKRQIPRMPYSKRHVRAALRQSPERKQMVTQYTRIRGRKMHGCQTKLEYDVTERSRLLWLQRMEQEKQAIKDRNEKRQKRRDEREKRKTEMELKKSESLDTLSAKEVGKEFFQKA